MFIKVSKSGYTRDGQQFCQGLFLVLCQPKWEDLPSGSPNPAGLPIHAFVRHCKMSQCGHWMIGSVKIGSHKLTMSGAYGADGLPDSVPMEVYKAAIPLPQYLVDAWNNGGGWNSAGSEATLMREWALENLDFLQAVKP